jgi:putative peptide maturation dehydrogenase
VRIKRCAILLIEPREKLGFDLASLVNGGDGLNAQIELFALAPHIGREVRIDQKEAEVLSSVQATHWEALCDLSERFGLEVLRGLLAKGLLLSDDAAHEDFNQNNDKLRAGYWHAHSAVSHYFGRWGGVDSQAATENANICTMTELVARLGLPPSHRVDRVAKEQRISLPPSGSTSIDELLARRATCRNFDTSKWVDQTTFSHLLRRVFGAQAAYEIQSDNVVIKRTSPSGGGLHPTDAYLLIRRVDGVSAGLYHYHSIDHALEPLPFPAESNLDALASAMVAAQDYFANAAVLIALVPRFPRTFWKYRNHSKAYRVTILDAGHLSQTLYISATEFGLGAFVTAAMNEIDVEQAFGLDPLVESPIAVLGFGHRGPECETFEFDPNRKVWPDGVAQPE